MSERIIIDTRAHRYVPGALIDVTDCPEVAALIAERDELKAAAEESKTAAHARIRQGYDTVVADSWRAKVAEVEAERDRLKEEVEMLRELLADQQRAFVESLALAQTPAA